MRQALFVALAVAAWSIGGAAPSTACDLKSVAKDGPAPVVQLALLLDTSNSMDGLIDQARAQLWEVVNQFAHARRAGQPASLQVALYEYGNTRLSPQSGWVRRVLPFTTDLDRVSEALFALETSGGDEFCGTVIQAALDQLQWGTGTGDLRAIFIAGNEPFTQGPVGFRSAVRRAASRGIVVNTIHCGSNEEGERTGWREGAQLAHGAYAIIDQGKALVHVEAPQDAELARLGVALNKTYVPYGAEGKAGQDRQAAQDSNASNWTGSAVNRAVAKANHQYSNSGWDLVDAYTQKKVDLGGLKAAQLPKELQGLSAEGLESLLLNRAQERKLIQDQINRLNLERQRHVSRVRKEKAGPTDTLDAVMAAALRSQAACQGIELD